MPKVNPIKHELRIVTANSTFNKDIVKSFSFDYHQLNNGVQYMDIYGLFLERIDPYRVKIYLFLSYKLLTTFQL